MSPVATYRIKIALEDVTPEIWRRVLVPGDVTLARLHDIIQVAMGWTNSHLHQFTIQGERFGRPDYDESPGLLDERRVKLAAVAGPGQSFAYEYDFGDGWEHSIAIEEEVDTASEVLTCIDGARACPPEDCGGAQGYFLLLEVLGNPAHEQHDELLEWAGGAIDPDALDIARINRTLAKIAAKRRPRRRLQ